MKSIWLVTCLLSLIAFVFVTNSDAGCMVDDGTFYSESKMAMTRFAIAMDQGDRAKALEMVDDGRIKSCSQASCRVIKRTNEGLVNVDIMGIGKVWIWNTFLFCK